MDISSIIRSKDLNYSLSLIIPTRVGAFEDFFLPVWVWLLTSPVLNRLHQRLTHARLIGPDCDVPLENNIKCI